MDDLFPLLMFLIFVLGPILEGLKRKSKQQQPPPQQRRMPPQPSRTEEFSTRPREESAATMVPDDLWEILTGQKQPPVLTTPQRTPVETKPTAWDVGYDADEEDEELTQDDVASEDLEVETRRQRVEAQSLETLERHPVPIVISLEENLPTVKQRHEAFHKKVATPQPPGPVQPRRQRLAFASRSELQRAFLIQEVLGRPKGLE